MKLLIDAHKFGEKHEGTSTYLAGMYHALMVLHPEWEYVFVGTHQNAMQTVFGQRPNVHYRLLKSHNRFWRMLVEMPRMLREERPDFAHFQYISPLWTATSCIVTTHDILFEEARFQAYFPKIYRLINGFLFRRSVIKARILCTVSAYSKAKIATHYGKDPDHIVVTPNAVQKPSNDGAPSNALLEAYGLDRFLLLVSRIEPRKNHLALYRSFVDLGLRAQGFKLVLIGKSEWQSAETLAFLATHKAELEGVVIHIQDLELSQLEAFYRAAEVFVYPSIAEGFGIPPLEAAVCGTKVVCSNATAMKDFDFFPYHVDPSDQQALNRAIQQALDDQHYDHQGLKELVLARYQWSRSAQILASAITTSHGQA
jgi:glycosyltransferase involved in cell wall biosynthesis